MAEIWGVLTAAAVGIGTAVYGADQQRKNNNKAIDANKAATEGASNENWRRYLMTRGVGDNGQIVNTKLPLWAGVARNPTTGAITVKAPAYMPSATPTPALGNGATTNYKRGWAGLGINR